ncbi:MAG: hypothetical protein BGN96_07510 [Bacteroidales bacterium 45-6]|nr:MAG: hypothetical protein BGN96_07510 [Bacteroidales bacterium 45-6]
MKNILLTLWLCCFVVSLVAQQEPYKLYTYNKYFEENSFVKAPQDTASPPSFGQIRNKLPQPFWKNHQDAIDCYWRAWEIAFSHLKKGTIENGFVSPYIDPAFNGNIFMWDGSFMTMFGRYGSRAFNFQGTLDNFYAKQVPDGFICREIYGKSGKDCFERVDPSSTGPNIMPWVEWEYFLNFNDTIRLKKVFPPLLAYYKWFELNRTWKDGSYFLSGWGCGMDNQPRVPNGYDVQWSNGHMSWVDACMQAVFAAKTLVKMANILHRENDVVDLKKEIGALSRFVNEQMWNDKLHFYTDKFRDGSLSSTQTVGSYWSLLAEVVPAERMKSYVGQLADPKKFARPHRVPSLAADCPEYDPNGGYWRGAVWAPTVYMVLRGLSAIGQDSLAHAIGVNHHHNIVEVFKQTGTFFENYAPEKAQGNNRNDFVGWTGLPPIAVLFEYVFGIQADVPHHRLVWRIDLTDEFGVNEYPYGVDGIVNLKCKARKSELEKPQVVVNSSTDLDLVVIWAGGQYTLKVKGKAAKKEN